MHNAAEMFSLDPNPTKAKNALFYLFTLWL
jgi:hypothetical protein